jgi:hypothetical protein
VKLPVSQQLAEAAAGIAVGIAIGLLYDVFRVIRRHSRLRAIDVLCDVVFCAAAGAALFSLGVSVGRGRHRIYVTALAMLGWALYSATVSRAALFLFTGIYSVLSFCLRPVIILGGIICRFLKKFEIFTKNIFHSLKKCYTIKVYSHIRRCWSYGDERILTNEIEAGKYRYEARRICADNLRCDEFSEYNDADERGKSGTG